MHAAVPVGQSLTVEHSFTGPLPGGPEASLLEEQAANNSTARPAKKDERCSTVPQ